MTDDVGKQDSADIVISSTSTTTAAPAAAGSNACPTDIPPPAAITVAASPASASLVAGSGTQIFTATLANASNTSVTWHVDGVTGGNATVGTISASGAYTAPAAVPSPALVTVTATSVEDPTKSGSAQVTITAPAPAPAPAPAATGGGGGGGAGFDLLLLLSALTAFARLASPRRHARAGSARSACRTVGNNCLQLAR